MVGIKKRVRKLTRVSSDEQANKGSSLSTQDSFILKSIDPETEVLDAKCYRGKGVSAKISPSDVSIQWDGLNSRFLISLSLLQRKELCEAIGDAAQGQYDELRYTENDRLTRSLLLFKVLKMFFNGLGVELGPLYASDDFGEEIKMLVSENEITRVTKRSRDNRLRKFQDGLLMGRPCYGYRLAKDKNNKVIDIEIDPERGRHVIQAYLFRLRGGTGQDCHRLRILERIGKSDDYREVPLSSSSFYNLINNKDYTGYLTFEGEEKQAEYTPLIPLGVWETVQLMKQEKDMEFKTLRSFQAEKKLAIQAILDYARSLKINVS